jgi:glycerol-1-phosphate dehydrogenase [NAD(P)+]
MKQQLKYDPTDMGNLKELLASEAKGQKFEEITLEKVLIAPGLVDDLPNIVLKSTAGTIREVLIVADETPIKYGEKILRDHVADLFQRQGIERKTLILRATDGSLLHADYEGVRKVQAEMGQGTAVIAIGGGTITDICKYAVYLAEGEEGGAGCPQLVVCQTATSGSAFGSNQAVVFKDGVKRTLHAVYPRVIIVDLDIIAGAPYILRVSGFGDMMGILISSVDWYVSNLLGMSEGYSDLLVNIMQHSGRTLLDVGKDVGANSATGLEVLAKILILMGIVSSMGFGTTPISGFEHAISHTLDMEGRATARALALHGAQVGLGAAYASVAYNLFLEEFSPGDVGLAQCYPSDEEALNEITRRVGHLDREGKLVAEIWAHYKIKLAAWRRRRPLFEAFLADWAKPGGPRAQIAARFVPSEQILKALYFSGNPTLPEELAPPVTPAQMRFAFLNARFARNRFALADIIGIAGMMNDDFWQKVDGKIRDFRAASRC